MQTRVNASTFIAGLKGKAVLGGKQEPEDLPAKLVEVDGKLQAVLTGQSQQQSEILNEMNEM